MTDDAFAKLLAAAKAVVESADACGRTDDLTVCSRAAVDAMAGLIATRPPDDPVALVRHFVRDDGHTLFECALLRTTVSRAQAVALLDVRRQLPAGRTGPEVRVIGASVYGIECERFEGQRLEGVEHDDDAWYVQLDEIVDTEADDATSLAYVSADRLHFDFNEDDEYSACAPSWEAIEAIAAGAPLSLPFARIVPT